MRQYEPPRVLWRPDLNQPASIKTGAVHFGGWSFYSLAEGAWDCCATWL
jgi:hypothetical protein